MRSALAPVTVPIVNTPDRLSVRVLLLTTKVIFELSADKKADVMVPYLFAGAAVFVPVRVYTGVPLGDVIVSEPRLPAISVRKIAGPSVLLPIPNCSPLGASRTIDDPTTRSSWPSKLILTPFADCTVVVPFGTIIVPEKATPGSVTVLSASTFPVSRPHSIVSNAATNRYIHLFFNNLNISYSPFSPENNKTRIKDKFTVLYSLKNSDASKNTFDLPINFNPFSPLHHLLL